MCARSFLSACCVFAVSCLRLWGVARVLRVLIVFALYLCEQLACWVRA